MSGDGRRGGKTTEASIDRHQLGASAIQGRQPDRHGTKPHQGAAQLVFVPDVVLVAERKVVRLDGRIDS